MIEYTNGLRFEDRDDHRTACAPVPKRKATDHRLARN